MYEISESYVQFIYFSKPIWSPYNDKISDTLRIYQISATSVASMIDYV